jgi:hypothetical protein
MDVMTPEQMECPECGRMMEREEDNLGYFYRCAGMDCLSHYGADEFFPAPPLPMPPRPTLEAEVLRLTEANAALAEELARMRFALQAALAYIEAEEARIGSPSATGSIARAALSHTGMTGPKEIA